MSWETPTSLSLSPAFRLPIRRYVSMVVITTFGFTSLPSACFLAFFHLFCPLPRCFHGISRRGENASDWVERGKTPNLSALLISLLTSALYPVSTCTMESSHSTDRGKLPDALQHFQPPSSSPHCHGQSLSLNDHSPTPSLESLFLPALLISLTWPSFWRTAPSGIGVWHDQ